MTSKVDICNLALIEAKDGTTITSLDERSVQAERCKRLYDTCRREVLCMYPWAFATKFEHLARVEGDVEGSKFAYIYPSDCLRITNLYKNESDYKDKNFRVPRPNNNRVSLLDERKVVMTEEDTPFAEYIYDEQIEDNFPPLFVKLLYMSMAIRLAKLSGANRDDIKLLILEMQQAETDAKEASISEDDNHINVEDDYYIKVRG